MDKTELFNRIKGKLIISCQALPGEPLYDPERSLMPYMARAAREAGSPMIRANTVRDVLGIKRETGLPVIGLIEQVYEGFDGYITPAMGEVDALAEAGADISDYQEGLKSWKSGIDLVSTTMSGYTDYTPKLEGPDFELVRRLASELPIPVIGEGRVHTPDEAVKMLDMGAWAVIVGGAITRPLEIAGRFMKAVNGRRG
ncbi:N-acetylmannosamine-6-phosphate 2-epimerase [Enterocloster clostridioformis]|uniref:N-acetylmannosamine-6-phosphate 2-epimerase n=1 Tax=Enterocloster clostridioformis TaxID=1531 RepID=UPI00080CB71B|nr:N-acetylmannosamine-6-phosphate 2-epimerase [Enterocloster clostridioformis]ANU46614.1 N-acetylmannosamine-6-phosphate 2-epimerase [Lachnoclostridium sp. YL32]NDO31474.1 N-acetylmannosamine-6-phosphate 2-epimerase [Enterocloster clostridioformis]OXE65323.1 N-acetylmannosamine-6-phosphate 2-epimerase [Enterocloster clostridioformis]QQQ98670.1 N-acetylmannosamine-6-phosphate 2-epimerase [Enterocloster clostridioformis]